MSETRKCSMCRWCAPGALGNECRFFDRDKERADYDGTAMRCPFYENRTEASQVGRICDAIYALAEAVERLQKIKEGGEF